MAFDFRNDPILATAYRYWDGKRGERRMPRRGDVNPSEIVPLLPNLQIIEVVDGGKRLRYRLVGTAIVAALGAEYTGKHFDEVFSGEQLRAHEENYRIIAREKCPLFVARRYVTPGGAELYSRRVIMPFSEDDEVVNQMLTVMSFHSANAAARRLGGLLGDETHFDVSDTEREIIR